MVSKGEPFNGSSCIPFKLGFKIIKLLDSTQIRVKINCVLEGVPKGQPMQRISRECRQVTCTYLTVELAVMVVDVTPSGGVLAKVL